MKVLWRSDMGQGKHDPLEITHVVTKSGSTISANLVVALDPAQAVATPPAGDADGLLEVIEAQLAAIDELTSANKSLGETLDWAEMKGVDEKTHADLKAWADQFPHLIEDLCIALGFARNPIAPTGIPELDILVRLSV